jgi:translation initiation factor IF-3
MTPQDALQRAQAQGLDLVEVAASAHPPVCRIMDYGKYKYEQKKKKAEAKRNATTTQLKEVKMRPKTDDHDFDFKIRHARRFLDAGDKVKVTIMFRGREMAHQDVARRLLDRVVGELKDLAQVESQARMEGRNMFLVLSPLKSKQSVAAKQAEEGKAPVPEPSDDLVPPAVEVQRRPVLRKKAKKTEEAPAVKEEPKAEAKAEKAEPEKTEAKAEPAKAEAKAEPAKAEAKAEPAKAEAKAEPAEVEPKKAPAKKTTKKVATKKKTTAAAKKTTKKTTKKAAKKTTKKKTTKKKSTTKSAKK